MKENFITWLYKGFVDIRTFFLREAPGVLIILLLAVIPLIYSQLFHIEWFGICLLWFFVCCGLEFLYFMYLECAKFPS